MMNLKLIFALLIVVQSAHSYSYDGYRLIEIYPRTAEHLKLLGKYGSDPEFDIWHKSHGDEDNKPTLIQVALSPKLFRKYKKLFGLNSIEFKIIAENIQGFIDIERQSMATTRLQTSLTKRVVGKYAKHNDINDYLNELSENNKDILSTYSAGRTAENRDLKVLMIKTDDSKRNIWIDCGIHAREWVTIASCTYFIDKLINEYNMKNQTIIDLLHYYEIHIIPVLNPDGYEYSRLVRRLWRKNRSVNLKSNCIGTDLNRNYPFKWMENYGASENPCSDVYGGQSAGSELEIQSVMKVINAQKGRWESFHDIHSYGQWYLIPHGYTKDKPADYEEMERVAHISADAIKSFNGTSFKVGQVADLLYYASGSSIDWSYSEGIKYSYTMELRPNANSGILGFIIPETEVQYAAEEVYRALISSFVEICEKTKATNI